MEDRYRSTMLDVRQCRCWLKMSDDPLLTETARGPSWHLARAWPTIDPARLLHSVWLAGRMLRFALDTGCVIDAAQGGRYRAEIDQLVSLARAGEVGLWLTSAFDVDQARASDENYRANLRWLSERPLIQRVQVHIGLAFRNSTDRPRQGFQTC